MTDALVKLLIDKGVITDAEFKQKLFDERAVCQRILNPTTAVDVEAFVFEHGTGIRAGLEMEWASDAFRKQY
jgi:hypothetical protein